MLRELSIWDFKLLRDATLAFPQGLTALTGETGAGKTQCLEALDAALGARLGEDAIAKDADKAVVSVVFDLSGRPDVVESLRSDGWLDEDDDEIILERTIERNGPSRGRLNGRRVPLGTLQAVGERIVDTLGQNTRADILNRPALGILDSLGDTAHHRELARVRDLYASWQTAKEAFQKEEAAITHARERRELAEFQFNELDKTELSEGEEESLQAELKLLSKAREHIEDSTAAASSLSTEEDETPSARDLLQSAVTAMERLLEADPSLAEDTARLREMVFLSEELAETLRRYASDIVDDPVRRAWIEERLQTLHQLQRKYKTDESGLIELRDKLRAELEGVATADERLGGLSKARDKALDEYARAARKLSKSRHDLAKRVSKEILKHLADLDLPSATFEVALETREDEKSYRADGIDRAELLIATNPAQTPAPLKKVASGGELSRILIALKTVLAERDRVPVLVFDEAEAGIGGETAFRVGEKLKELSRSHQLVIVSHLPQIACQADGHWVVEKRTKGDDTRAEAREVSGGERVGEIGRMLGARGDKKALEKLARSFLEKR